RAPYPLFFSYARQFRHYLYGNTPNTCTECSITLVFCSENAFKPVLPYSYAEACIHHIRSFPNICCILALGLLTGLGLSCCGCHLISSSNAIVVVVQGGMFPAKTRPTR
ncbi:unnamed protein product, partial [Heterosigma akashiwo]